MLLILGIILILASAVIFIAGVVMDWIEEPRLRDKNK